MTPEQEAALARARSKVKTTSEPGVVRDPNAPGGGLSPFTPEQQIALRRARERVTNEAAGAGDQADKYIRTAVRGTGEGIASTLDLLPQAGTFIGNRINSLTGRPLVDYPTPFADAYNKGVVDVPAGYETTNDVSSIVGPAIVETAATLGTGAPAAFELASARAAARATARGASEAAARAAGRSAGNMSSLKRITQIVPRALAETGAGIVGGEVGGYIGDKAGSLLGSPETGAQIGSFIGAAAGPAGAGRAGRAGARTLLTDADSPARLAAAERLGVEPSLGLVGSKQAAGMEDYTAGIALGGGPAYRMRRQQYEDMDRAATNIAADMRGRGGALPSQPVPAGGRISKGTVGEDIRQTAETAQGGIDRATTGMWEPFMDRMGRETVVPDIPLMDQMRMTASNASGTPGALIGADLKPIVRNRMEALEADRIREVDPAETRDIAARTAQVDRWEQAMRRAAGQGTPATPGQVRTLDRMQTRIEQERALLARRADENTGTNVSQLKDWRSNLGKQIDANPDNRLPTKVQNPIYGTASDVWRDEAARRGIAPDEFQHVMDETTRLSRQGELVSPLVDQTSEGRGYNQMFSSTNEQSLGLPRALEEHAPLDLAHTLANNFELETRGASAGAPTVNPETVKPRATADFWQGLPEEARLRYGAGDPTVSGAADDLATVSAADARRPTRTLPGAGGNTLGGPLTTFTLPALAAGAGIGAASGPGVLLATLPTLLAQAYGRASTSPGLTRTLVNPPTPFLDPSRLGPSLAALNAWRQSQEGIR